MESTPQAHREGPNLEGLAATGKKGFCRGRGTEEKERSSPGPCQLTEHTLEEQPTPLHVAQGKALRVATGCF